MVEEIELVHLPFDVKKIELVYANANASASAKDSVITLGGRSDSRRGHNPGGTSTRYIIIGVQPNDSGKIHCLPTIGLGIKL